MTVRLKYGIHTISLLTNPDWPFSRLTTELLTVIQERYPNGLTASIGSPDLTPIPAPISTSQGDGKPNATIKVAYGLPKQPDDLSEGWKYINAVPSDKLGKKGFTDMCTVAFVVLDHAADETQTEFVVDVPEPPEDEEMDIGEENDLEEGEE